MINQEQLEVFRFYSYPHPSGWGSVRTQVREITRGDHQEVRHESQDCLLGATVPLETFLQLACLDPVLDREFLAEWDEQNNS